MMSKTTLLTSEYQQLLRDLKNVVESLLLSQVANVWNVYGGLNQLHSVVDNIFKHQFKISKENGALDCWSFIQGLTWLQPDISCSTLSVDIEYQPHLPTHLKTDKVSLWLYRSLENHTLSQKLSWLLSDKEHLLACYHDNAFMLQESYTEATLICLHAVERNDPSSLSELNPCLYYSNCNNGAHSYKAHRRCVSFPESPHYTKWNNVSVLSTQTAGCVVHAEPVGERVGVRGKLKPWRSLPNLTTRDTRVRRRSCTIVKSCSGSNSPLRLSEGKLLSPSALYVNYSDLNDSHADRSMARRSGAAASVKDYRKRPTKSWMEDGGVSVVPMWTGYFPRPTAGQTLTSFLSSGQFSRANNAELDRENAHFSVSEAMIAAIERIKCGEEKAPSERSTERGGPTWQRVRLRRRWAGKGRGFAARRHRSRRKGDEDRDDVTAAAISTTSSSSSGGGGDDGGDDDDGGGACEAALCESATRLERLTGVSTSMASLYSAAEVCARGAPDGQSAEGVALSLISRFSERQLPRASSLEWLVSAEEAGGQTLLPLPREAASGGGADEGAAAACSPARLRGTHDWAPPRPQLIFTPWPAPRRARLMEAQRYRCAGCGMAVERQYAGRFRYCDYLGKYFCTGCHANQLALVPGRVLARWDFARYAVSTFAYRLLDRMHDDPLFRLVELNPALFERSRSLARWRAAKLQLHHLRDFVLRCRFATAAAAEGDGATVARLALRPAELEAVAALGAGDPEMYSLRELTEVKRCGEARRRRLADACLAHVSRCELCQGRAFNCELCRSAESLFPWQAAEQVARCERCGACSHAACRRQRPSTPCRRCTRLAAKNRRGGGPR